jgi:hypothetical protein
MKAGTLCRISIIFVLLCGLFFHNSQAMAVDLIPVDIWGTKKITAEKVYIRFGKELAEIMDIVKTPNCWDKGTESGKKLKFLNKKISDGIKSMDNFLSVDISHGIYFREDKVSRRCITIDVVEQKDKHRLAYFLPEPTDSIPDPDNLIGQWKECMKAVIPICGHCLHFFDHPGLEKYKRIFDERVPENKENLIAILKNDRDYKKREEVPFLLEYIKNGKELVKILIPFMRDPHYGVRNNVMLVIGETLTRDGTIDFPVDEAITALDFPRTTDRNKALYILNSLANRKNLAPYIAQHAGKQIIDCLKMTQPNHHDLAYDLLQTISGQKYGDRDYEAWQKWLDTVKETSVIE